MISDGFSGMKDVGSFCTSFARFYVVNNETSYQLGRFRVPLRNQFNTCICCTHQVLVCLDGIGRELVFYFIFYVTAAA